jgi:hypothetical protein
VNGDVKMKRRSLKYTFKDVNSNRMRGRTLWEGTEKMEKIERTGEIEVIERTKGLK